MIADFQFPISDLETIARQIGNWQLGNRQSEMPKHAKARSERRMP
jgi:hypothetical protein